MNIAYDLIKSDEIVSIQLDKIHRQAENSAIITESTKARKNIQLIPKDWVGTEVRGNLHDFTLECYSDASNTFYRVMEYFSSAIDSIKDIMDLQVIVPTKDKSAGTWNINTACQSLYNPPDESKPELDVYYDKNHSGTLRVGDKVINMENNYKAETYVGQWEPDTNNDDEEVSPDIVPIYNGSMGIIKAINIKKRQIVVDFQGIGNVLIKTEGLKSIQLAYAITCHKIQGSEVPYTIVGMDFSAYVLLTKEWLYTALTRSSVHCTLVAQNSALRYAVTQNGVGVKQTHLVQALYDLTHPTF